MHPVGEIHQAAPVAATRPGALLQSVMEMLANMKTSGVLLGVSLLLLSGCAAQMPTPPAPRPQVEATGLPSYEEVVEGYNQRIAGLPRLWARTVGRIWYPDEDGRTRTEQVEGHLQYIAPDRLLLNFDKVSQTYGLMGSNEERYWWIELDRERRAYVGDHARVTPERIEELGMPIYPRDVIDLLGITPLPVERPSTSVAWNQDRRALIVTTPSRVTSEAGGLGTLQRLWIDPQSFEPRRIEMLDADGGVRVVSDLSKYERVSVPGGGPEVPRPGVPGEIVVATADERTQMRLRIYAPQASEDRPRAAVFDLEQLLRRYRIREVISLDEPRAAPQ